MPHYQSYPERSRPNPNRDIHSELIPFAARLGLSQRLPPVSSIPAAKVALRRPSRRSPYLLRPGRERRRLPSRSSLGTLEDTDCHRPAERTWHQRCPHRLTRWQDRSLSWGRGKRHWAPLPPTLLPPKQETN